jgi:hypothetical protein
MAPPYPIPPELSAPAAGPGKTPLVFSLYGRHREFELCLESLRQCAHLDRYTCFLDINQAGLPVNAEIVRLAEAYQKEFPHTVITKYTDGYGSDFNNLRTVRKFREKIIYFAGDVLLHPQALVKYEELNAEYPDAPLTLYHSKYHRLCYLPGDRACLDDYAFESLYFYPHPWLDDPIFDLWVMGRYTCVDWILSWLYHKKGVRIYSTRLSWVQHLGITGGNTNIIRSAYAYDYVDQSAYFAALRRLGVDENLAKMVKR